MVAFPFRDPNIRITGRARRDGSWLLVLDPRVSVVASMGVSEHRQKKTSQKKECEHLAVAHDRSIHPSGPSVLQWPCQPINKSEARAFGSPEVKRDVYQPA